MSIDVDYLNKNLGPTVYLATDINDLKSVLATIRLYTASKSVNDVIISSIIPIPLSYDGQCDVTWNNTTTETSAGNILSGTEAVTGKLSNVSLKVTMQYLLSLDISPIGA